MRTLLEIHYDEIHLQNWRSQSRRAPARKSEWHVFSSTINAHRKQLCQRIQLPKAVKDILRQPTDEEDPLKLEKLRDVIAKEIQGYECLLLETPGHILDIAEAVEKCTHNVFMDEIGYECHGLPSGCRVVLNDGAYTTKMEVAEALRGLQPGDFIDVFTRPFGTERAPLVDAFSKKLGFTTITELEDTMSRPKILDMMLLSLFDALFLRQSEGWSQSKVANLKVDETPELARWFLRGYNVGSKPIFDGICSMCATLLHGDVGGHSSLSNKEAGPPTDRDGTILVEEGGTLKVHAQPPFLLRYSPSLFAKEAPAMFKHDPESNMLSLVDGMHPPWLRKKYHQQKRAPWLYCTDCQNRYFKTGKKQRGHIPFRDKASQALMKKMPDRQPVDTDEAEEIGSQGGKSKSSEEEPEAEDTLLHLDADEDEEGEENESKQGPWQGKAGASHEEDNVEKEKEEEDEEGDEGNRDAMDVEPQDELPDTLYPSLQEYQAKWDRLREQHSKANPGPFSYSNLVPEPIHQLWQNCPYVPFEKLVSNDAVSRLSRCRPMNGFTPAHVADNVVRYAHNTGEVNFRKRHPLQLASTLGFILNKRKGHFPGLKEEEKTALHECLTWLRQPGNNPVCFYGRELEIYDRACKCLMKRIKQFLPEGSTRARIRATNRVSKTLQDGSLGDTLGDESRGFVVLDFEGHAHKFDEFSDQTERVLTGPFTLGITAQHGKHIKTTSHSTSITYFRVNHWSSATAMRPRLQIMADVVAKEINVFKIDAPRPEGRGWKRTYSELDTDNDLGEEWKKEMSEGAKYVLEESHVKANDPHYDLLMNSCNSSTEHNVLLHCCMNAFIVRRSVRTRQSSLTVYRDSDSVKMDAKCYPHMHVYDLLKKNASL